MKKTALSIEDLFITKVYKALMLREKVQLTGKTINGLINKKVKEMER